MTLVSDITYLAPFGEIKEEKQIIALLEDVKNDLVGVDNSNKDLFDFKKLLNVIDGTKYEVIKESIRQVVDLSKAKHLIDSYRRQSEGGCQSCKEHGHFMPYQDEHIFYCKLYEQEKLDNNELDFENSPRISKFSEKGCKDKKPVFTKTIEQILKENKSK